MRALEETVEARRHDVRANRRGRLERMLEIRIVEDRVLELFADGVAVGTSHTAQGQEAVAVGLAAELRPTDWVTCTYRGHGIALALGMTPGAVVGEILGRTSGCVGGLGGSMHLCDVRIGLLPTFAIVGAGIPIAVGAALSAQVNRSDGVAVAVFGDGATNIGAFHESLNLAAIWKLPVLFVVENNVYGEYTRIDLTTPSEDLAERAAAYRIPSEAVDGQDVEAVGNAVARSVDQIRVGSGPHLLEMKTYRFAGHARADLAAYRPEGELEHWLRRDPITIFRDRLVDEQLITLDEFQRMEDSTRQRVDDAIKAAIAAPAPEPGAMFANIVAVNG